MDFKLNQSGFIIVKVLYVIFLVTIIFQFTLATLLINVEVSKNFSEKIKQDSLVISGIYAAAWMKGSANFSAESSSLTFHLLDETILELAIKETPEAKVTLLKINEEIVYNHYY